MAAEWVLSVSELNEYVRRKLAGDPMLRSLNIRGELSGFKRHYSGHLYFTLKDEQARIQCVMFRQDVQGLRFEPRDGMRVVVTGSASLFVRDGSYQLYVEAMRQEGVGELYLRFEALKQRLMAEGLFDEALKRPLPLLPRRIGVVTSQSGAVIRDIVRVARRRDPGIGILLCPAQVQGAGAAQEIAGALDALNRHGGVDVILCGRGGGSIEDLWAFNEEVVARAIRRSCIPVVSCVGHETDFTIADFAADLRAPTPSAAAELAVPVHAELVAQLMHLAARMARAGDKQLADRRKSLKVCAASPAFKMPAQLLLAGRRARLEGLSQSLERAAETGIDRRRVQLTAAESALRALSPRAVLGRGYALLTGPEGVVDSVSRLHLGMRVDIALRDGRACAQVETIEAEPSAPREEGSDGGKEEKAAQL